MSGRASVPVLLKGFMLHRPSKTAPGLWHMATLLNIATSSSCFILSVRQVLASESQLHYNNSGMKQSLHCNNERYLGCYPDHDESACGNSHSTISVEAKSETCRRVRQHIDYCRVCMVPFVAVFSERCSNSPLGRWQQMAPYTHHSSLYVDGTLQLPDFSLIAA